MVDNLKKRFQGGNSYDKRPQYGKTDSHGSDGSFEEIIAPIRKAKNLSEVGIDEIAKENGITENLAKLRGFSDLKTSQLRKFFDILKKIQVDVNDKGWNESVENDFYMIRVNLAYARGRGLIPDEFFTLVSECIAKVISPDKDLTKKNYLRFVQIMEAMVAYHKYTHPSAGGRR
jgi:CRISPR-associated protein Csm2